MKNSFVEEKGILPASSFSPSQSCYYCGNNLDFTKHCHYCGHAFCKQHIIKTRVDENDPQLLHPICEKCEKTFIQKQIYEEFSAEKKHLEEEIFELRMKEKGINDEIDVKTETYEGIRNSKNKLLERLTNEVLDIGQQIEKWNHLNRAVEKEILQKNLEKEALEKEIEALEAVIKEFKDSSDERSPTGYGFVWEDGLVKKKEIIQAKNMNNKNWNEKFCCGCSANFLNCHIC